MHIQSSCKAEVATCNTGVEATNACGLHSPVCFTGSIVAGMLGSMPSTCMPCVCSCHAANSCQLLKLGSWVGCYHSHTAANCLVPFLQDLLAALVLSECVYKKLEMPAEQLGRIISEFTADFPPELVHIEAVQLSLEDVTQK